MSTTARVTELLLRHGQGDPEALERALPLVYAELRRLAAAELRRERAGHTLQPTALVHEAYLRLVGQDERSFANRRHFVSLAALAMRRVLLRHAERRAAAKRGGGHGRLCLSSLESALSAPPSEVLGLEAALERLTELDPRSARVVELRFFGGLSVAEAAEVLEVSERTVEREWRVARAFLRRELEQVDEG